MKRYVVCGSPWTWIRYLYCKPPIGKGPTGNIVLRIFEREDLTDLRSKA